MLNKTGICLIVSLLLWALMGCVSVTSQVEVNVVSAYEGQAAYVAAVEADPQADKQALYLDHAVIPYWGDCVGGEAPDDFNLVYDDLPRLSEAIAVLRESNIEQQIKDELARIMWWLPGPETTVCIYVVDDIQTFFARDHMNGVMAFSSGAGKIGFNLEPTDRWQEELPYTLAHEHHHSVLVSQADVDWEEFTLLDYLVLEGRADSFAAKLYPELARPWTTALTAEQEKRQWMNMQENLQRTSPAVLSKFMFGRQAGIPQWSGYTIGYGIVQAYLEAHPELSIQEWTAIDAEEILRDSGYGTE